MITQQYLKECLDYDSVSGKFRWIRRPLSHFKNAHGMRIFNSRFVGKDAGHYHKGNYLHVCISGKKYELHRLAWLYVYGEWPKDCIDHVNHIRDDNRIENLREVTRLNNQRNISLSPNSKSGVFGVNWRESLQKWHARIKVKGNSISLGYYVEFEEALKVRKEAEKKYNFHPNHGT